MKMLLGIGLVIVAIAVCLFEHCRQEPLSAGVANDPIAKYDLNESYVRRDVVSNAVSNCDIVLGSDSDIVLRTSWDSKAPPDALPVYLIDADSLPSNALCFVPSGDRCVFISSALFDNLGKLFDEPDPTEMDRQSGDVLAIMLLHECGHLHNGDSGSFGDDASKLNIDATATKDREMRADQFAADRLRAAKADMSSQFGVRSVTAMMLMSEVMLINFNFFGARISNLGAREFHDKGVYWDQSLTHPNLEFRMLDIAAEMDPQDETAKKNLQDFLEAREPLAPLNLLQDLKSNPPPSTLPDR